MAVFLWVAALLAGCSDTIEDIPLATLVEHQAEYDGRTLTTAGTVRTFDDPLHYWVEDDNLNRVAVEPDEAVADLVGKRVRVTGEFSADRVRGRILQASDITVE